MARPEPKNRLKIHWDMKGKRVELSAAGVVGVIGLLAMVIGIVILVRVL